MLEAGRKNVRVGTYEMEISNCEWRFGVN